jgi:Xaa-Pro aminopeptidase
MNERLLKGLSILAGVLVLAGVGLGQQPSDGLAPEVYKARREKLMQTLGDSSAMILFSAQPKMREWDSPYEYHQDSDFLYLTGIDKENCALMLAPRGIDAGGNKVREIIFLPPRNPMAERWFGERLSFEAAKTTLGFQEALANDQLSSFIDRILPQLKIVYLPSYDQAFVHDQVSNQRFWIERESQKALRQKNPQIKIKKASTLITAMRTIKSPEELALMQQAIDLTCASLREAIAKVKPGMFEYELEAQIEYGFKIRGAEDVSFPSIVGSGPNSTSPHYWENRRKMEDGDVVVLDVGADLHNYAADVTRTIPVNGKFSPAQREIYDIVHRAQQAAMEIVKPGVKFTDVHATAKKVIEDSGYGKFFIHGTSHGLGLDTHDPGNYDVLAPGMVFTIEPGIYIPANTEGIDSKYWNVGVRIEDDILVTENGYKLMSSGMPREISEVEKLMKKK